MMQVPNNKLIKSLLKTQGNVSGQILVQMHTFTAFSNN